MKTIKCKKCNKDFTIDKKSTINLCSEKCRFDMTGYKVDNNGCHIWNGTIVDKKYGTFTYNKIRYTAHRFSCESVHGPAPKDKPFTLHSCDNPSCINPDHLRWGSSSENAIDREKRNRRFVLRGSNIGNSKLNEKQVNEIKKELINYQYGDYIRLGKKYNVSETLIKHIRLGKLWKHV